MFSARAIASLAALCSLEVWSEGCFGYPKFAKNVFEYAPFVTHHVTTQKHFQLLFHFCGLFRQVGHPIKTHLKMLKNHDFCLISDTVNKFYLFLLHCAQPLHSAHIVFHGFWQAEISRVIVEKCRESDNWVIPAPSHFLTTAKWEEHCWANKLYKDSVSTVLFNKSASSNVNFC